MIYIEGARNAGKTYLLDRYLKEFPNKFYTYKFPYFPLYEKLKLEKELNAGNYFSFGKDLDLLSLAKANLLPKNLLLDRGFISSIVFAMLFRQAKTEDMTNFIELIKNSYKEVEIKILYVEPNQEKRTQMGLNEREKDQVELPSLNLVNNAITDKNFDFHYKWIFEQLINCPNIAIHRFTNNFDEESVEAFNSLLNSLYIN